MPSRCPEQRRGLVRVELPQGEFERGEELAGGRAADSLPAPFRDRMQRRVLLHSVQVWRVSTSRARNSPTSRDLPMPGSPTIKTSCPLPACAYEAALGGLFALHLSRTPALVISARLPGAGPRHQRLSDRITIGAA